MNEENADSGRVERIGYLCIQGYPRRICCGCTFACREPVFAYPDQNADYERVSHARCSICHERVRDAAGGWVHVHSGDRECWTGDGSTAYPEGIR